MEYMLLIHAEENYTPAVPGTPDFDQYMAGWFAYNQKLIDGGHWVSGGSLQPSVTATTLRREGGTDTIVDGPYAETKEHLGGYYLVKAADLDEALELAKAIPMPAASIEVRPVAFRPDAS